MTGTELVQIPRMRDFEVDGDAVLERLAARDIDLVMISNPNNPTGGLAPETLLIDILNTTDALVLVDEAYFEFSRHTMRPHLERHPNLVLLRTFSKAFSLAGLRVGYLLAHEDVVTELTKVRQPYSVDRFSQWVAGVVFRERVVFEGEIQEPLGRHVIHADQVRVHRPNLGKIARGLLRRSKRLTRRVRRKRTIRHPSDVEFLLAESEKLAVHTCAWPGGTRDCHAP